MRNDSLKKTIQKLAGANIPLITGTVLGTEPLKIQMDNDAKMVLGERVLSVPEYLRDYEARISIGSLSAENATIHNALKEDEKVLLLGCNDGKKYVVLGRV